MNRKQSKGSPTTDNERSSVNSTSGGEEVRGDQGTTSLKRAVARRNGRAPNRLDLLAGLSRAQLDALRTRCLRGHELTPENTREHGKGNRACRLCERVRAGREHLNPLGLPARSTPEAHDALRATAKPTDWRTRLHVAASITGARRVASERSAYAARAERRGELADVVAFLQQVRREVVAGGTLIEAVADATLLGWRAREALNSCLDEPLANWDRRKGRTQLERRAVVERALAECGVEHRGGWSVGDGR